jgi:hypothetical protein
MSWQADDPTLVYFCRIENKDQEDGEYLVWCDNDDEIWSTCGIDKDGSWFETNYCGKPSEWRNVYGNLSLNYCERDYGFCGECEDHVWNGDYLCVTCRGNVERSNNSYQAVA